MSMEQQSFNTPLSKKIKSCLQVNLFLLLIILGVLLGILLGILANYFMLSERTMDIVAFLGDLMLRMLNMLILPLIISSTITALSNLGSGVSTKICLYSMVYYFSTTIIASVFGIAVAAAIFNIDASSSPSIDAGKDVESNDALYQESVVADSIMDIIRNLFPDNLVGAFFQSSKTVYKEDSESAEAGSLNTSHVIKMNKTVQTVQSPNVIGLIVFSCVFGSVVGRMENNRPFVDFFTVVNRGFMKIIELVMWYTPFGIMCLLICQMRKIEFLSTAFQMLAYYAATMAVCCLVHGLIIIPTIYFIFTRKNVLTFYRGIMPAMLTAFGTDSSLMTLPMTKKCLEENVKIDENILNLVLPIGTTINMDGATFFFAAITHFIASVNGIHLGIGDLIMICITSIIGSVGSVGLPYYGFGITVIVLRAVNLPVESVPIIFTVDWLLTRFRTMNNVAGDCVGAAIVYHFCSNDLDLNMNKEKFDHSKTIVEFEQEVSNDEEDLIETNFNSRGTKL